MYDSMLKIFTFKEVICCPVANKFSGSYISYSNVYGEAGPLIDALSSVFMSGKSLMITSSLNVRVTILSFETDEIIALGSMISQHVSPFHVKPISILHSSDQPSPSTLFASSHSCSPKFSPSPQTSTQLPKSSILYPFTKSQCVHIPEVIIFETKFHSTHVCTSGYSHFMHSSSQ